MTAARPVGATTVNDGRPSASTRTSTARMSASADVPTVTTRARVRDAHLRDLGVVGVEDREPLRSKGLDQLALGLGDRLPRAELADVGDADVEDDGDVRRRDRREVGEVADPPRPHLGDEEAGVRGHPAHRQRYADLPVERVDRGHGRAGAAEHLGEEILGRGLPGGAGHGDDGEAGRPVDDPARHRTERELDVVHDDAGSSGTGGCSARRPRHGREPHPQTRGRRRARRPGRRRGTRGQPRASR